MPQERKPVASIDYSRERRTLQDGDIILFRGKTLLSRLIRWITRSPYSHAGVVGWWEDRLMVLEARGAGVVASRLSHVIEQYPGRAELWTADDTVIREVGLRLDRTRVVAAARMHLGKQYATWKLFAALRKLMFGTDESADPRRPPKKFVCSEYVSMVWNAGGVDLSAELDKYTKPGDIAKSRYVRPVGKLLPSPRREDGSPVAEERSVELVA